MRIVPSLALAVFAAGALFANDVRELRIPGSVRKVCALTNGPEFPGAKVAAGYPAEDAVRLDYDFTGGGNYVGIHLGRSEEGAVGISAELRSGCEDVVRVSVRALDSKDDYYIDGVELPTTEDFRPLDLRFGNLSWCFGKSTNAADRAKIKWPLTAVDLLCQPVRKGRRGTLDVRRLRLRTTAAPTIAPNRSFTVTPSRFGALFRPDETIRVDCHMLTLDDGVEEPSLTIDRIEIRDWLGKRVCVRTCDVANGCLALSADDLNGKFGAFKVTFWGVRVDGQEVNLGETWFARLPGPNPKPLKWIGTGGHGWWKDVRRYDLMAAAGIGTFRNDASWADCERKPGVYTEPSGFFRENVAALKARGISLNLCMPHKNTGAYPERPFDSDAYAAFAEWVARSYPEVDVFEIFNEPSAQYWQALKAPWTHLFLDLTAKAKNRIRAVRPDANIVVCAECELRCLYWELEGGIAEKGDCVSFHPYVCNRLNPRPEDYEFFWNDEGREIRRRMAEHGGADRLRITEIGWTNRGADKNVGSNYWYKTGLYPGVSYEMQAQLLVRAYLIARSAGVESIMQYDFVDDGSDRDNSEHNFGIMFGDYTPKPSFAAIAAMARIVGDAKPLGDFSADRMKYRMYVFERPDGKRVYAMWAIEGKVKVDLPTDVVGGTVCDLMGNSRPLDSEWRTVEVSERPCYIVMQ